MSENEKKTCPLCRKEMTRQDTKNRWVCLRCGRTKPFKVVMTLAERIRVMDDEELARFLYYVNHGEKALNRDEVFDQLQRPADESVWPSGWM